MESDILYDDIAIQSLLDKRPKPSFHHATTGIAHETWNTLACPLSFLDKHSTFGSKSLDINFFRPHTNTTHFVHNNVAIPALLRHTSVKNHNITLSYENIKVGIVEHIIGVLTATNHIIDVKLSGGNTWPTEQTCMQEYYDAIQDNSICTNQAIEYVTPSRPFFLRQKNGAYVGLLPAEHNQKYLRIDLMVSYPGTSIGTQRIVADIDDAFAAKIVGARPASYGLRAKLVPLLHKIPAGKKILDIHPNATFRFKKEELLNPRPQYFHDDSDIYLELVFHEILDKLGAIGLLGGGRKLAGTFVSYKANHAMDIACMKQMIKEGVISL